ncbi:hypothetical protein ANO11243_040340 [Dothideomycetidae sp. 11243]|nr:hypothetical protein ANO11243_040340 [fungal sp. No.11243]
MAAASSKELIFYQATAYLIDPLTAPEPSAETGPGTHFVQPPSEASVPRNLTGSSTETNPFRKHHNTGSERFPGDNSHKPLDIIRRDSKKAARSPHLTKRHMPGTDSIDRLDPSVGVPYHHEGPYDAASWARNTVPGKAPIDALKESNAEALKATPPENIKDSLDHKVPLSGTATVPPGTEDRFGRVYNYEEGANQMFEGQPEGGQYKRWDGVKYHPDDIQGKGEPYYSRDIAENRRMSGHREDADGGIEMSTPTHGSATGNRARSGSFKDGLKKRIGSLKKKHRDE